MCVSTSDSLLLALLMVHHGARTHALCIGARRSPGIPNSRERSYTQPSSLIFHGEIAITRRRRREESAQELEDIRLPNSGGERARAISFVPAGLAFVAGAIMDV